MDLAEKQDRPMDFNEMNLKRFDDIISYTTFKENLINYHLSSFAVVAQNIHNYLKTIPSSSNFLHTLQPKHHTAIEADVSSIKHTLKRSAD